MSVEEADCRLGPVVYFYIRRKNSGSYPACVLIEAVYGRYVYSSGIVSRIPPAYVLISSVKIAENVGRGFSGDFVESRVFVLTAINWVGKNAQTILV